MKTQNLRGPAFQHLLLCLALLLPCPALFSQAGRGGISGQVTDASGAIVPGATVTAKNAATGESLETVSNAAGFCIMRTEMRKVKDLPAMFSA